MPIIDRCGVHVDGDSFLPKREVDVGGFVAIVNYRRYGVGFGPRVITAETTSNPTGT